MFTLCAPLTPATWADGLPSGAPPEVAYVVGTTVHLPGGERVPIDGEEVSIVGVSDRGTMLLVEWRGYVWVAPDGTASRVPDGPWSGVQDEVLSPDGRWFARGDAVVDLVDGSVVAAIPERAEVLTGWTAEGVRFWEDGRRWVWRPGDRARPERRSDRPWLRLTRELGVVDRAGRHHGYLAGVPLQVQGAVVATYWTSRRTVLIGVPGAVVRCDVRELTCERALDRSAELPVR